ncbi:TIGR02678 family protein [Nocardia wallacei]|uniref:TIGR02678 family protein n=1 Tax=Nocardia wallacei TaxID=480035 RepID=UPI0024566649|nr:TIGR02678 family protein [Nocardia wallacei]
MTTSSNPPDQSLGTRRQDAASIREAARALLRTPVITAARAPETLALIRWHATALRTMFNTQLGYRLTVEASFARLAKLPPEHISPRRALTRRSGTPFGVQTYTLVTLACAALLAPGTGEQVLISHLVNQIRSDAAEQGIALSDTISDRRQLVAALTTLIDWGVLTETDGSVVQWGDGTSEEALLTVCRPLLPHLLVRSIGPDTTPADVLAPDESAPRRRLRRRLAEDPVVLRGDLTPEELDALSRERSELTRLLNENFGLILEVRAEGALAYDPADPLTDIEFPGTGSLKQATLLLIGVLLDQVADHEAPDTEFAWPVVDTALTALVARHRRAWKGEYADSVATLREDVIALLKALRLAEVGPAGLRLFAAAARYRPHIVSEGTQLAFE